jgi:hypothetical protein
MFTLAQNRRCSQKSQRNERPLGLTGFLYQRHRETIAFVQSDLERFPASLNLFCLLGVS